MVSREPFYIVWRLLPHAPTSRLLDLLIPAQLTTTRARVELPATDLSRRAAWRPGKNRARRSRKAPPAVSVWPREAVQSAARQSPPKLYGRRGREDVGSTQEHGARLAARRADADRPAPTRPHPGWAACQLCRCAPQEEAAALPTGRVLLFSLPHAQGCSRRHGRLSAGHTQFRQSDGSLLGLRHPHVPAGRLAQTGGGGWRIYRSRCRRPSNA